MKSSRKRLYLLITILVVSILFLGVTIGVLVWRHTHKKTTIKSNTDPDQSAVGKSSDTQESDVTHPQNALVTVQQQNPPVTQQITNTQTQSDVGKIEKPYYVVVSEETFQDIQAAVNAKKSPGPEVQRVLLNGGGGQSLVSAADYIDALMKTKEPTISSFNVPNGSQRWTAQEMTWMGDLSLVVQAQAYDHGNHCLNPTRHNQPIPLTMAFVNGPMRKLSLPDGKETIKADGSSDFEGLYKLHRRRVLPVLAAFSRQATAQNTRAFVTVPGLGCSVFAGKFAKVAHAEFVQVMRRLVEECSEQHFPNVDLWIGTYMDVIAPVQEDFAHPAKLFLTNVNSTKVQQLSPLSDFAKEVPRLFAPFLPQGFSVSESTHGIQGSLVAWGPFALPGNGWNSGSRSTDDGVKGAATNVASVCTGVEGAYKEHGWSPKSGSSSWSSIWNQHPLETRDKIYVYNQTTKSLESVQS